MEPDIFEITLESLKKEKFSPAPQADAIYKQIDTIIQAIPQTSLALGETVTRILYKLLESLITRNEKESLTNNNASMVNGSSLQLQLDTQFQQEWNASIGPIFSVFVKGWTMRQRFVHEIAWAIPTQQIVKRIVSFVADDVVLEIGSGSGLWAFLLQKELMDRSNNVIATDIFDEGSKATYTKINVVSAEKAPLMFPHANAILFCWPPVLELMAHCLQSFKGKKLIYIGDPKCTATVSFFDIIMKDWVQNDVVPIPTFTGIDDRLYLYTKREPNPSPYYVFSPNKNI